MPGAPASASLLENVRFNALVVVPNAVQGIFRRRRAAVAAATKAGIDGQAVGLLRGMARAHDRRPVWVRVVRDRALLLLDPSDAVAVLDGSPEPYASDPKAKRDGMVAFQPEALTISRGEQWRRRRAFAESVLGASEPDAIGGRIESICGEEVERLIAGPAAVEGGRIGWDTFHACVQRIARRVILGDGSAGDTELSEQLEEMMSEANGMPGEPSERLPEFMARLSTHVDRGEAESLAAYAPEAPAGAGVDPAAQMIHWLFALGDTLAINALRALAVLAADERLAELARTDATGVFAQACLSEAMRLWPTTPMLSRETTEEVEWGGEAIPAGTQVLVVNTFAHRDPDRIPYADRFAPEEWIGGEAAAEPAFNHFSRGPQGCPGADLALAVGRALLATMLDRGPLRLRFPSLDTSAPMPRMLDFFAIEVEAGG